MIYVISKSTFGDYNVRDIQCNANWDCCPYSDYALIPENMVEGILATKGYCDITLNSAGTEVTSFTARSCPSVPEECRAEDIAATVPKTANGSVISVGDSGDAPLLGLKLYGKTVQNGTPTPENPAPLESVGAGGAICVTVAGKNLFGGIALADKLVEVASSTKDISAGTVTISGANVAHNPMLFDGAFKENTQYTIVLYGRNNVETGDATNLNIFYTDGTNEDIRFPKVSGDRYVVHTTMTGKTVSHLYCRYQSGISILYYDQCGIFEGVLTEADYEPYKGQTLTASTPNGLPGIPVTSGGNYTDESGQQWICDEIDFGRGVYVQRVIQCLFDGDEDFNEVYQTNGVYRFSCKTLTNFGHAPVAGSACMSDKFVNEQILDEPGHTWVSSAGSVIAFTAPEGITTIPEWKNWLANNHTALTYQTTKPIETPLTAEELAQYATLHSNKPTTTVFNDGGAEMEIRYCTPNTAVPMNFGGKAGNLLSLDEHGCVVSVPKESMPFAPAGYGLGSESLQRVSISELDTLDGNGWYLLDNAGTGITICNIGFNYALARISSFNNGNNSTQELFIYNGYCAKIRRFRNTSTSWYDWECENPPMEVGVEYRTTERWNGKPVYIKLINIGAMPDNTIKTVSTGLDSTATIIYIDGHVTSESGSHTTFATANSIGVNTNDGADSITVETTYSFPNSTATVLIKYTKE